MFDFLKKDRSTRLQKWLEKNQAPDQDVVLQAAKMIFACAAGFVPRKPKLEKEYVNRFYNDMTIVELAIFFLFHFEFILQHDRQSIKVVKTIKYFNNIFQHASEFDYFKLIVDRTAAYEASVQSFDTTFRDSVELLEKLIIDCQNFNKHRLLFESENFIPISPHFILDNRFKHHLHSYLKEMMPKVIQISEAIA